MKNQVWNLNRSSIFGISYFEATILALLIVGAIFFNRINLPVSSTISLNLVGMVVPSLLAFYVLIKKRTSNIRIVICVLAVATTAMISSIFLPESGVLITSPLPLYIMGLLPILFFYRVPDAAYAAAYISGVLGMIIEADLVYLPSILSNSNYVYNIGGNGVFDGIFGLPFMGILLCKGAMTIISSLRRS